MTDTPLTEDWWLCQEPLSDSAADVSLLAPYERTRPGFETCVSAGTPDMAACFPGIEGGFYVVNLWNIWKKEDLAGADPQKQAINQMQLALGHVTDEDRYLRIQIACLARCFWTFPATVDLILDGIGNGAVNLEAGISCEPPWTGMREILSLRRDPERAGSAQQVACLHHQQGLDPRTDPRQKQLRAYMTILTWWMAQGSLDCLQGDLPEASGLAVTLYRWLGRPDRRKLVLVQKLIWHLSFWAIPHLPGGGFDAELAGSWASFDRVIAEELGESHRANGDAIARLIAQNQDRGSCHHAFIRHVDHIIAQIGSGRPVTLPGAGEERTKILGAVAGYTHAIGSWLAARTQEEAASFFPQSRETLAAVYRLLGQPEPRKRWLAACLWKKLQEDRAHAGRGMLAEAPARFSLPMDVFTPGS